VRNLDSNGDQFVDYLTRIGAAHRGLRSEGLSAQVWEELGVAIVECLRKHDALRKHNELRRAWLSTVAFIIDHLKQGQQYCPRSASFAAPSTTTVVDVNDRDEHSCTE